MPRATTGTVEFRGNPPRWWARVTVRDEHGAIHRPWIDLERPDLKNTPEGREAAKRLAAKRAKVAKRGVFVGVARATAPRVSVASLGAKWFALLDGDAHLKSSTRQTYKSCFTSRVEPTFGKLAVVDLTVPVLRAWIRELCDELSPSTVRNNAIALARFLNDVRAEGWVTLDTNPMKHEDVRAVLPTVEAPDPEAIVQWTREECETLLALPSLPDERFGLYVVALLTGLRAGEMRGLTFAHLDVDVPVPVLKVRQQRALARAAGESTANSTPKTRSSKRDVPLHPAAAAWLSWWRDEGWRARFGRDRTDDDPVFPAGDGEAGRPRDANILRRDLEAAGLPLDFTTPEGARIPYTFHATRRTFSRLLADAGVPMHLVSMLAGHAGESVTERHYVGRSLEAMARAVATIKLALPARAGVVDSSCELSGPKSDPSVGASIPVGFPLLVHEQPIELPQLRHSQVASTANAHASRENKGSRASNGASGTMTESAVLRPMKPLENKSRTLQDDPRSTPDHVERALASALERTADPAAILAIVGELAARRAARS